MKPSSWVSSIAGYYPASTNFSQVKTLDHSDARIFASIWLAEGVPFAFLKCPGVFQAAREEMAKDLGVSSRDISMTGSGRIGYSMSPNLFGRQYTVQGSDIDLFLIGKREFDTLAEQATKFCEDFRQGTIEPRHDREREFWADHLDKIPKNIESGFVDAKKIPTWNTYPASQKFNNACYRFIYNVNSWSQETLVNRAGVRVYRDWEAAINRIAYNLRSSVKYKK